MSGPLTRWARAHDVLGLATWISGVAFADYYLVQAQRDGYEWSQLIGRRFSPAFVAGVAMRGLRKAEAQAASTETTS